MSKRLFDFAPGPKYHDNETDAGGVDLTQIKGYLEDSGNDLEVTYVDRVIQRTPIAFFIPQRLSGTVKFASSLTTLVSAAASGTPGSVLELAPSVNTGFTWNGATGTLTFPESGLYALNMRMYYQAADTAFSQFQQRVVKSDGTFALWKTFAGVGGSTIAGRWDIVEQLSGTYYFSAGESVTFQIFASSTGAGGDILLYSAVHGSHISAYLLV